MWFLKSARTQPLQAIMLIQVAHIFTLPFQLKQKEEDMIKLFREQSFNMQWTNGDVHEVLGIDKCFEDHFGR